MSEIEKPRESGQIERDPVFYYSRERRLSRASPAVRALNDGSLTQMGLSKRLLGNKGNILILFSVLVIMAMFSFTSRFSAKGVSTTLGGNTLVLTLIREGDALGLEIEKTVPKSGEFYIGTVDISVSPALPRAGEGEAPREIPAMFSHRFSFRPFVTESFFISLPFDGDDFLVILGTENEQKLVRVR